MPEEISCWGTDNSTMIFFQFLMECHSLYCDMKNNNSINNLSVGSVGCDVMIKVGIIDMSTKFWMQS